MNLIKNSYCSYCGKQFSLTEKFPKKCITCLNVTYVNPLPGVVSMIRVWKNSSALDYGFLIIKRNIEPHIGGWAFPGGYVDADETWQEAASRELQEEVGLKIDPNGIDLFDVKSASNGNIIIFNTTHKRNIYENDINFILNDEVSDIDLIYSPIELAFPTHTQAFKDYCERLQFRIDMIAPLHGHQ